jgi:WD40 repeat protein
MGKHVPMPLYKKAYVFHRYRIGREFDITIIVVIQYWSLISVISPDGQLLASGSTDETIKLWDPIKGELRHTFKGHSNWVWSESNVGVSILDNQWVCPQGKRIL